MKSFEDVYNNLRNSVDIEKLNTVRKTELKQSYILVAFVIVVILSGFARLVTDSSFFGYIALVGLIGLIVYLIYYIIKHVGKNKHNSYKALYKDEVMEKLVNRYDEGLHLDRTKSISRQDYNKGQFEFYELYSSNDYIYGDINGKTYIQMGDVLTQNQSTDSNGNTTTYTVFSGLFCMCALNSNTNNTLKVRADKGFLGKAFSGKKQVNMDSQEFEKNFDVYSDDKVLAMRLLTSDIMDFMITFKKENKIKFDFTLLNDMAYVRISCSNLFESALSKDPLDEKSLHKYYNYLDFMCRLCTMISNVVEEKDI